MPQMAPLNWLWDFFFFFFIYYTYVFMASSVSNLFWDKQVMVSCMTWEW